MWFDGASWAAGDKIADVAKGTVRRVVLTDPIRYRLTFASLDGQQLTLNGIDKSILGAPIYRDPSWFQGFQNSSDGRWLVARANVHQGYETVLWDLRNKSFAKIPGSPARIDPLLGGGYSFNMLGRLSFLDAQGGSQSLYPDQQSFIPLP
jgi:hypothetical protein